MICKICDNNSKKIFQVKVLKKYKVTYYQCDFCGFIQTEEPYWLEEAYSSAIADMDTGILRRNFNYSTKTAVILNKNFSKRGKFLDYGAGYGIFVRLMRDRGLWFFGYDKYSTNIFSNYFNHDPSFLYEAITAFEVFEHLESPIEEIERMMKLSQNILFSTLLIPSKKNDIKNWWYINADTGQHICFYTLDALKVIAEKFGLYLYSNQKDLHFLTKKKLSDLVFLKKRNKLNKMKELILSVSSFVSFLTGKNTLTDQDRKYIKDQLL